MPSVSVFGAQWGDEGKGKIIDLLSRDADVVVRYQGGANAGHTVVVGGEKYVLHHIPSGILHKGKLNVIGNGVAVEPKKLLEEIAGLCERGTPIDPSRLLISARAHVIFEHHKQLDLLAERWKGDGRIGTTGRGIGPCYADKAARTGLRVCDLLDPESCRTRLTAILAEKNALLEKVYEAPTLSLEEELEKALAFGKQLEPYICDAAAVVRLAYREGKRVLFEAAQGVMLDIDHGTYPYVTSSSTGPDGIAAGAGFPVRHVERATGIAKAYCTRVGEGPFPSEDHGAEGERIREAGNEYGATTGRPRRCGWFDGVAVQYALELSGADTWIMTNLDVLTGFETLKVAVAYEKAGKRYSHLPAELTELDGLTPIYESHECWTEDITAIRSFGDLPESARSYVRWLEKIVGVPIELLSVGPEREQVIPVPAP
ncbi:MAG: adenylosuccinate synthase [Planctomycetota bacterium]|jgi:adenylosuccinate synthase